MEKISNKLFLGRNDARKIPRKDSIPIDKNVDKRNGSYGHRRNLPTNMRECDERFEKK